MTKLGKRGYVCPKKSEAEKASSVETDQIDGADAALLQHPCHN